MSNTPRSSATLSRSNLSKDEAKKMADEMLRASLSRRVLSAPSSSKPPAPPPKSSSASVNRSQMSSEEAKALADKMLRASLSRAGSSSSSAVSTPLSTPLSPPLSSTPLSPPRVPSDPAATLEPPASLYSDTGVADAPAPEITAAERKLRLRRLDSEVERVKSEKPQRSTAGLFKQACSTDLLFLIDTTYSMQPYLDAAKNQVKGIVSELKKTFLNQSVIRVAVVGYKDHADNPHIQMCDFTESTEDVYRFLDSLTARGGGDAPEDVLGGIKQALAASWRQQTRCLFHIADAPPHGRGLHDLKASHDDYYEPGSEPHKLLYEPLIRQMALLRINYALLRITSYTDRMALAFSDVYAANRAEVKLLPANAYQAESQSATATAASGLRGGRATSEVQWEELQLGTSYADIHHLIVRTATSSVTRTAGRLSKALSAGSSGSRNSSASRGSSGSRSSMGTTGAKQMSSINALAAIVEDDRSTIGPGSIREKSATTADESPTWDEEPAWDDDVERVPLDKSPRSGISSAGSTRCSRWTATAPTWWCTTSTRSTT